MADTVRGDFPDAYCSDCGRKGCILSHWGPLVPNGKTGYFCASCFRQRAEDGRVGKEPAPLRIEIMCDGCNVRGVFEHRCHGANAQMQGESTNRMCECPECNNPEYNTHIPATAFIVKTKNSTYRFGLSDGRKVRTVSRDEKSLDFTQCQVSWLKVGDTMLLKCFDGPHFSWHTTEVVSVESQ